MSRDGSEKIRDRFSKAENVKAMPPRPLSDRAKRIVDEVEFAADFKPILDRPYIIKGWLDRGATSMLVAAPGAGKTFFALNIAHHVQEGIEWAGCRVKRGAVLYIAAEGGAMLGNRIAALRTPKFMVLRKACRLTGQNSDATPLAEVVSHLSENHGPFALIVIDTMARVMGEADENTAPAIASLFSSLETLRHRTGAHVMLVHHLGKDAAKGARGHSSITAAVDTIITIEPEKDGDQTSPFIIARGFRQREMQDGREFPFTLQLVELGTDSDGDRVTTRVVKHERGADTPKG